MHFSLRAIIALALISAVGYAGAVTPNLEKKEGRAAVRWADSVYNTLTERQRVSQLVFPTINPKGGASSKAIIKKAVSTDA